jgi:hypothetical protein
MGTPIAIKNLVLNGIETYAITKHGKISVEASAFQNFLSNYKNSKTFTSEEWSDFKHAIVEQLDVLGVTSRREDIVTLLSLLPTINNLNGLNTTLESLKETAHFGLWGKSGASFYNTFTNLIKNPPDISAFAESAFVEPPLPTASIPNTAPVPDALADEAVSAPVGAERPAEAGDDAESVDREHDDTVVLPADTRLGDETVSPQPAGQSAAEAGDGADVTVDAPVDPLGSPAVPSATLDAQTTGESSAEPTPFRSGTDVLLSPVGRSPKDQLNDALAEADEINEQLTQLAKEFEKRNRRYQGETKGIIIEQVDVYDAYMITNRPPIAFDRSEASNLLLALTKTFKIALNHRDSRHAIADKDLLKGKMSADDIKRHLQQARDMVAKTSALLGEHKFSLSARVASATLSEALDSHITLNVELQEQAAAIKEKLSLLQARVAQLQTIAAGDFPADIIRDKLAKFKLLADEIQADKAKFEATARALSEHHAILFDAIAQAENALFVGNHLRPSDYKNAIANLLIAIHQIKTSPSLRGHLRSDPELSAPAEDPDTFIYHCTANVPQAKAFHDSIRDYPILTAAGNAALVEDNSKLRNVQKALLDGISTAFKQLAAILSLATQLNPALASARKSLNTGSLPAEAGAGVHEHITNLSTGSVHSVVESDSMESGTPVAETPVVPVTLAPAISPAQPAGTFNTAAIIPDRSRPLPPRATQLPPGAALALGTLPTHEHSTSSFSVPSSLAPSKSTRPLPSLPPEHATTAQVIGRPLPVRPLPKLPGEEDTLQANV